MNRERERRDGERSERIEARRIVRLAESASLSARRVAKGDAGKAGIGFTAVSGYTLVPRIVTQARATLPNIELELREMVTSEQTDALLTGLIDIAFVRPPVERGEFNAALALSEPLVVALPPGAIRTNPATEPMRRRLCMEVMAA